MRIKQLVYYDTSSLFKSGFYLNGFYLDGQASGYRLLVKRLAPTGLREAISRSEWQHTLFSTALFEATTMSGGKISFCIDSHDLNTVKKIRATQQGYHLPLLEKVDAYFKVNYNREVIENSPLLREHRHKIFPVNQFISLKSPIVLPFFLWPPPVTGGYAPGVPYEKLWWRIRERARHLKNWVTLEQLMACRSTPKDLDVFFVTSFRHEDRHKMGMESRLRLVEGIRKISNIKSLTGLASYHPLPVKYSHVEVKPMQQSEYLDNLTRAKIVVYTQGSDECLASKFALFPALGMCVVGHSVKNNTEVIERYPHLKKQFAYSSTDAILERIEALVNDPQQISEIASRNVDIFDKDFSPVATAKQVLDVLGKGDGGVK